MGNADPRRQAEPDKAAEIAIAVVEDGEHFLVGQRPEGVPLAGFWEFPGGKVHGGESTEQAAVRECQEETGQLVRVVRKLTDVRHSYEHGELRLHFFACRVIRRGQLIGPFRWVSRSEIAQLEFPPANRHVLEFLSRSS